MRIEWKITKKRGNLRPELTYCVTLEEYEKALALPPLRVLSSIPKPQDSWQEYCYPGQLERECEREDRQDRLCGGESSKPKDGKKAAEYYELEIPSHKGRSWPQSLRLPWRADNSYPEVEASFIELRRAFEEELAKAGASQPMKEENSLQSTEAAKTAIAPAVLAERFLQLARKSASRA